jgi:hypothetical protein
MVTVRNADELRTALALRCEGTNEFALAHDADYPVLQILAKGNFAYVHFCPADRQPGAPALGDIENLPGDGSTDLGGGPRSTDHWWIGNRLVVRAETALAVAEQFRATGKRPSCVEWCEL